MPLNIEYHLNKSTKTKGGKMHAHQRRERKEETAHKQVDSEKTGI